MRRLFLAKSGRIWRRTLIYTATAFGLFLIADLVFPLPKFQKYSQAVYAADSSLLHLYLSPDHKWRLRSRQTDISPALERVILFREDRWFRYHPGINPFAVIRALWQNTSSGERVSGASTITMQTARLLERRPRTYLSKFTEMFRALQLEWHFSKQQILQMWLDHVSYGGNIEGIRAASLLYFGCEPGVLSRAQLATLLVIPNNPNGLRPGRHDDRLIAERNRWLQKMTKGGLISQTALNDALNEPLTMRRRPAPSALPHLSRQLLKENPDKEEIFSLVRPDIQKKTEQIAYDAARMLRYKGIGNVAVIVMNNSTGAVEAYAGSADFSDNAYQGQVDGLRAVRSPGSTLKPLLYAFAFEKRLLTPMMTINDVPTDFMGYMPENYNRKFNGRVTVAEALARSLNLPAVKILEQTGTESFTYFLARAGFRTIARDKDKLGLSMILGGCGVTAKELTSSYSAFARGGIAIKPRFTRESPLVNDTLFGPEAAWMTTTILTMPTRPDLPVMYENSTDLPPVAWKTGTSYGRRDGWAVGFNSHYTITVWAGNFDGKGSVDLSGADVATPILFNLFQNIDKRPLRNWLKKPESLKFRMVCSESGLLPGDSCKHLISDAYIPGRSPSNRCEHLKAVWTNRQGTVSYCSDCLPPSGTVRRWYPNYSPDLIAWFTMNKIPYKAIPPHNPDCERVMTEGAPLITSPSDQAEYLIAEGDSTPLMLSCQAQGDVSMVHWYVDHRLLKTARRSEQVFFHPQPGIVRIGCADDKGRSSFITIKVKYF